MLGSFEVASIAELAEREETVPADRRGMLTPFLECARRTGQVSG
jgi:hypothetical protein